MARLCVTTRSYALNAVYSLFLSDFSYQVVDIPLLTDNEISEAVAGTALEDIAISDSSVREVLRTPYYLRLAFYYTSAGSSLPHAAGNDLRLLLWTERVAPSKGLPAGLAARRRVVFDEVCYARTERFAQFVDSPNDAEAVASLVRDAVLAMDVTDRVAPAHDVLEDWSLFFRVEREVRGAERDWDALFSKLGSHSGMRRALRVWTAQRSAEGDSDAFALLEAAFRQDSTISQLWRDEVAIGLLRSEKVDELVEKLGCRVSFSNASLLQRLSHLLRVACKGPTSIDYTKLADDPENKEMVLRFGMAAPVGKAWDVVVGLVAKAFPSWPPECNAWVVQLAEDATSHDDKWRKPTQRVLHVFNIAEHFCLDNSETWYGGQSIDKRYYALLCRSAGADVARFTAYIETLLQGLQNSPDKRDFYAEERLEFLVNFKSCREASFFNSDLVWKVFCALYMKAESGSERNFGFGGLEAGFGLSDRAAHGFFPPSVLQGPFRSLLLFAWPKSVRFVVDLLNHAAISLASTRANEVVIVPPEQSPNGRQHIHDFRLWVSYRGHSVTSYILNAALMALEERLLIEAKAEPKMISHVLEIILELGESSLTTGMVAGVLMAHPELVTKKLLSIFKCPQFFLEDVVRTVQEPNTLAIHGGNDGLDDARQRERVASNRLPHRHQHLEALILQLQLNRPELRDDIYRILDTHLEALNDAEEHSDGWRIALKRMDVRGLRFGEPDGDCKWIPLEIANLEPELQQVSDIAQARMHRLNRICAVSTWASAVTGRFSTAPPGTAERFSSPSEPYEEFLFLCEGIEEQEIGILTTLEDELACALIRKWPSDTSQAIQWGRALLLERTAICEDKDAWLHRDPSMGELRARTVISLAATDPTLPKMAEALVNIVTEPVWKVRRAAAMAISDELRQKQPFIAEVLTTGLAQYAEALEPKIKRPQKWTSDFVDDARVATIKSLSDSLQKMQLCARSSPKSLAAVKEWTIALDASRSEIPDTWRVHSLTTLARLVAEQEGGRRVRRHDSDYVDFEARWELGDLIAAELMSQPDDRSALFETMEYCLENAPELSERILESVLSECMKQEFANASSFWRVWDRAMGKVFGDASLRTQNRRSHSQLHKVIRTLLFCSTPWPRNWRDMELFKSRPNFISNCLVAVGDSRVGLENLLQLMAGVGIVSAVPSALSHLRDALRRAPADLFDDGNSLWYAETICRIAVNEHREALIQDIKLRRATLDILDRLVDGGSSIGFQLRDYLATSPIVAIESQPVSGRG